MIIEAALIGICSSLTALIWKRGISGKAGTIFQGLIVMIAASITAGLYVELRAISPEITFIDKFWISVPLLASFIVSGRCVFGRLIRIMIAGRRGKD
jgi:hypothetical protein